MTIKLAGAAAVGGIGMLQYKRGQAPIAERGVLLQSILQACDDAQATWITRADALTLAAALARVMADPLGEYWR